MTITTINQPGLNYAAIPVTAESRASIAEQPVGRQMYRGLMVDGTFYPLVLCKHVNANPEMMVQATDAALEQVRAAIASLQAPPATTTREIAYDRNAREYKATLNGELIGYYPSYLKAEEALDDVAYDLLSLDSRPIPRCGDCGAALGDLGFCEECTDRAGRVRHVVYCDTCARDAALRGSLGRRVSDAQVGSCACCRIDRRVGRLYELKDRLPAWVDAPSLETVRL